MKPIARKVTIRKYFREVLKIFALFPPFSTLNKKQLEVASELLYFSYLYKDLKDDEKFAIVFHYDTKNKIAKELNTSMATIDNILTKLRGIKFLQNKTIRKHFLLDPNIHNDITFKFEIIDETK